MLYKKKYICSKKLLSKIIICYKTIYSYPYQKYSEIKKSKGISGNFLDNPSITFLAHINVSLKTYYF